MDEARALSDGRATGVLRPTLGGRDDPRVELRPDRGPSVGLWLSLLVCVAGSLLTVATWNSLSTAQERELGSSLDSTCTELARELEARFNRQHDDLLHLGASWSQFGVSDVARWQAEALLFMRRWDEFVAVVFDPDGSGASAIQAATEPEGLERLVAVRAEPESAEAYQHAVAGGAEAFLRSVSPDGQALYELIIPIEQAEGPRPVIAALLDPAVLIERTLARPFTCALSVVADGAEILQRGQPASSDLAFSRAVRAPASSEWTVTVRPGPDLLGTSQRRLPWILLGAGLIISVLLAMLVRLGHSSAANAQRLAGTNRELVARMLELQRAGDENRSLGEGNLALLSQREQLSGELAAQTRALEQQRLTLQGERKLREQLASELESLRSEAERRAVGARRSDQAVNELEAFTYSVSHDLRSPLGAILNYAAILVDDHADTLDDDAREHLARISVSARNAVAMMDGLLAFSRIGRHELVLQDVDVRALVREIHAELSAARPDSQPRAPELSMGELPSVRADATLLRMLFTNLLSNAFKFTRAVDAPHLEVGGYVQGASTVYYVEDNGIGFDMRHVSRLFGVFERLVPQSDYEGHGVGLAIVARIAERHGGSVRAEGAPNKGATLFVALPTRSHENDGLPT